MQKKYSQLNEDCKDDTDRRKEFVKKAARLNKRFFLDNSCRKEKPKI